MPRALNQRGYTMLVYAVVAGGILIALVALTGMVKSYLNGIVEEGYKAGTHDERAKWLAREAKELAAANAEIERLHIAAREEEGHHAEMLAAISKDYEKELGNARLATKLALDAVRSGSFRLYNPCTTAGKGSGLRPPGEAAAAAGKRDGASGADVQGTYAERVARSVELAGEADEVTLQLQACQRVVLSDREGVTR
jgi:hypothetical protein